jgi:protein SCO1/2
MSNVLCAAVLLGAALGTIGCGSASDTRKDTANVTAKVYDVTGKVVGLDRRKPAVTLDHKDIPGLMKAMKMEFKAADAKVLDGLAPGDAVEGKLKVENGEYTITELRKR